MESSPISMSVTSTSGSGVRGSSGTSSMGPVSPSWSRAYLTRWRRSVATGSASTRFQSSGPSAASGHVEVVLGGEPGRRRGQPAVLALVDALDDHRLVLQADDRRGVGHLVDVPGAADRDLGEVGVAARLVDGVGRWRPCSTSRPSAGGGATPASMSKPGYGQVALRVGRPGGQLGLHQEVVRHGGGRLEVEALLRPDAAVGEVREHHQRHRRAVAARGGRRRTPRTPGRSRARGLRRCRPWSG